MFENYVVCVSESRMALDAIYVHVEANDVLATSFTAMHVGKVSPTEHAHYVRRGNAPNLNDPRPLRDHLNYASFRRPVLRSVRANYGATAS